MWFMREKRQRRSKTGKAKRATEQGFTLIETTIAMMVMMVAGLGVMSLFVFSVNNHTGVSERAMAVAIAQQRIERMRAVPFTDASLDVTAERLEYVTVGNRQFTVRTAIAAGALRTITVQVTSQGRGPSWGGTVTFTTQRATNTLGPNR
jgi:Tfp pilus assembly protein PilV